MLCEFNRPVCVVGSFNSGPDTGLKEEGETMKRWGGKDCCTLAKSADSWEPFIDFLFLHLYSSPVE